MTMPGMPAIRALRKRSRMPTVAAPSGRIPLVPELARPETKDPLEAKAKQGVIGSLPERIIWKWLEDQKLAFQWQQSAFGGRMLRGGMVLDFVVLGLAAGPVVIRVQGDYWHGPTSPGRPGRDDDQAQRLRAKGYIVLDLWESDIYAYALRGELRVLIERAIWA